MSNLLRVGALPFSYLGDTVEKGQFGKIYNGQYEDTVDVMILRIDKSENKVDTNTLRQTDMHPNIVRFYGAEEDGFEFQ